ncbi:HEAT repeat domain-containing protein [Archangium lipolyticum]|uniref:HEAT repeat domain-containing protein n=1 Tax=Archangium lipolyticum TaxID=2970465 RepID=UPI002149D89A|nr:HEAT repeat domain-containing protein [Archangium lipolyticum]
MKKLGVGLLLALVGGGSLAWWKWGRGDAAGLSLTCVPGQSRAYALSYESRGQMSDPAFGFSLGASPEGQSAETVVTGRWRETCVRTDATSHVLEVSVEDAKGHFRSGGGIGGGGAPMGARELVEGKSFVVMGSDGSVRSIHFDPSFSPLGENILRDMLSMRSVSLKGPLRDGGSWTSEEEDVNGRYNASYALALPGPDLARVTKVRQEYLATGSGQDMKTVKPLVRALPGSESTLELELDTYQLRSLRSRVEVSLTFGGRTFGQTTGSLALTPDTGAAPPTVDPQALQRAFSAQVSRGVRAGDLAARDADARIEERIQREELGDETWQSLLEKVGAASPDRAKLFLKFRALFLLHPETCQDASKLLALSKGPHELDFQLVAGALVSAGTPEAQQALVAAIEATGDRLPHQRTLTPLLGMVAKPTEATESALHALVRDHALGEVRDTARLALGNMARTLQEQEPGRAERLVQEGVEFARSARNLEERVVAIQTLGNTGSPQGFEYLSQSVKDPNAAVRQKGVSALRFIETEAAERLLLEVASRDEAASVRGEAVVSLSFRRLSAATVGELLRRVRQDPSESVRQLIVKVLADEAPRYLEIRETLEQVSREDASSSVRKVATLVLLRLDSSEGS